ncbi:sensor histidine kinase [Microbacterium stercoris]|uniref:histidine kinase n=1 Tax=Microbacterium stercoris TaxID=2820289 RepID=A0A939TU19_9MICO|nr:histidine kinase [Microbacterium stercoris]MBO3663569.1 sensor domain-containing protein [Microbacterium stercoris]
MTTSYAPARPTPARLLAATAHLAAVGVAGPIIATGIGAMLAFGVGLLPVVGIGLIVLVGLVYVLFGIGWAETARIDGLYGAGIGPLRPRPRSGPGFGGWLRGLWHQAIDGSMWRAIANLIVSSLTGLLLLFVIRLAIGSAIAAFAPLYATDGVVDIVGIEILAAWAPLIGGLLFVASLAGILGLAVLHGVIARAIIIPSREAQLAAAAREATQYAQTAQDQRAGAVRAADVERTRIERDLHDGVQPRLVSIGMTLGLAQQKIDTDPAKAKDLVAEAHTSTKAAITELRQLARGIHASVLDDRGLDAALSALASRSHVPVRLDVRIDGRCSRDAEAAVYFALAESLTNAAKHSRATECRVTVRRREDGTLWARVEDDGIGGAQVLPGGGLDGIVNRVTAAGGTIRLDSPQGGPTSLEVSVPCAS